MYLNFFGMREMPFSLTPNTQFYCALPPHNEAMQVLLTSLELGEGFIKVIGEVGTGKTLLCRKLLNGLPDSVVTAYLPNPYLSAEELRWAFAAELGLKLDKKNDQQMLSQQIHFKLMALHAQRKQVVLIVDEAQSLSWEAFEALRLFGNLETENKKLLQVVLFGQHELDEKLAHQRLRQLRQRISFSYTLRAMTPSEVSHYIQHRLKIAGSDNPELFKKNMTLKLAKASRGTPRLVNILCHKILLLAFGQGQPKLTGKHVKAAIKDTQDCIAKKPVRYWMFVLAWLGFVLSVYLGWRQDL